MGEQVRKHPEIYSPEEATEYLHLDCPATLETLRGKYGLVGYQIGKRMLYYRADLDACALRMFGRSQGAHDSGRKAGVQGGLRLSRGGA